MSCRFPFVAGVLSQGLAFLFCFVTFIAAAFAFGDEFQSAVPDWNFGIAETGATLTNVFELRNASRVPLMLRSVRTSCACTVADWSKLPVPPGSSTWVQVVLKVPAEEGPVHKFVTADWRDDKGIRGETVFTVRGAARSVLWLVPAAANFGVCTTKGAQTIFLSPRSLHGTASVARAACTGEGYRVEVGNGGLLVHADTSTTGPKRGVVNVRLSDGTATRDLELPAFVYVQRAPAVVAAGHATVAQSQASASALVSVRPVHVEVYGQPGCELCRRVEVEVLPVLVARFGQHIWIDRRDVENPVDLSRLLGQLGRTITNENPRVCVVVSGRDAFVDDAVFSSALEQTVSTRVSEAMNGGAAVPLVSAVAPPEVAISQAYRRFGWGLVLVAGLVDGINPCAIGTLVFFVSLLAAGKAGKGRMAAAGLAFCLGVYVTYVVLGFGLLRAWRAAEALPAARFWLRTVLAGTLAVLAALSFRDAAVFSRSGNASAVRLKLPRRLMEASHRLARRGVTARWLLPACMVMGVAVTLIGTVCTGQAYIPALAFMARQGSIRATAMLLSYNAMFVLPLVAILVAVLLGWRSVNMAAWTRREVVVGKVALGLLFVAMGVVIWVPW